MLHRSIGLAVTLGLLVVACGDKSSSRSSASATPAATDQPVVIELGPDGQTRVQGKEMKGDAATCTSMKACCAASSDVSLFCGLAQATDGATCASVLKDTQQYLTERKLARPAGCP